MPTTTDQTPITVGRRAAPDFAQDPQTRSWVIPMMGQTPEAPNRVQIMRYTQLEIARLVALPQGWDGGRALPLHPALSNVAFTLVAAVTTRDGLATPQFSPSGDGGLDIVWLVGGNRLTMSLETDEFAISGTWSDGRVAFRHEDRWDATDDYSFRMAIEDAKIFLDKISADVRHQILAL
jgi:hypothetical protein